MVCRSTSGGLSLANKGRDIGIFVRDKLKSGNWKKRVYLKLATLKTINRDENSENKFIKSLCISIESDL